MLLRHDDRLLPREYHEKAYTLEIIRHFRGLEELKLITDLSSWKVVPSRKSWIRFLSTLVEVAKELPKLRSITISTLKRLPIYPFQSSSDMIPHDVPGWAYNLAILQYTAEAMAVIETLHRMHQPHFPPAGWMRDRIGERIERWWHSQRTFPK